MDFRSNSSALGEVLRTLTRESLKLWSCVLGSDALFSVFLQKNAKMITPKLNSTAWVTPGDYSTSDFKTLNHQGLSFHNGNLKMSQHHHYSATQCCFFIFPVKNRFAHSYYKERNIFRTKSAISEVIKQRTSIHMSNITCLSSKSKTRALANNPS